jgi:hypothetical protein
MLGTHTRLAIDTQTTLGNGHSKFLLTCEIKGLTMVRDVIRIPSRKSLAAKPPMGTRDLMRRTSIWCSSGCEQRA